MRRILLAGLLALATIVPASAQFAPPGIGGQPRGSAFCQFLTSPPTLLNGTPALFQCDNLGIQLQDLSKINGTTASTGNGTTNAGDLRVNLPTDNSNVPGIGGSATASAVPSAAHYMAGIGSANLTGVTVCDHWTPISQTTGTQLFAGTSSLKTYICSINLVTTTAQNVALVGGTGTVCATSTHAIAGGTTAATGWNFAANNGIAQGSGIGVIMQAGTAADNLCLLQSSTGQISGSIGWTQY